MLSFVLVVTVCSVAEPKWCSTREIQFGSVAGLPGACERYAQVAIPHLLAPHAKIDFDVRYRCRRADIPEGDA